MIHQLARRQASQGSRVIVVHATRGIVGRQQPEAEGVEFIWADQPKIALGAVMASRANIVHLHGVWDPIVRAVALGCARVRVPTVISSHGMVHPLALERSWLKKRAYMAMYPSVFRWPAEWLCLNKEEADWASERLKVRTTIAPPGIDVSEFDQKSKGAEIQLPPIRAGEKMALFVGRLERVKGLDLLIDAFRLTRSAINVRLIIAGPDQGELRSLVRQCSHYGLSDRVHFTGLVDSTRRLQLLRTASLYVHRPRYEGFGLAVAEAMASRLPVLTTAACKLPGAAASDALRCVLDDSRTFADQFDLLMEDENERRALGIRARVWVESNLSWDAVLRIHSGAYQRAVEATESR